MSIMRNEYSSFLASIGNSLKHILKFLFKLNSETDCLNEFLSEINKIHKCQELSFKVTLNICKRKINESIQNLQIFELSVDALKSIMNFNDIKSEFLKQPVAEIVCFMMPEVYKLNTLSLFSSAFEANGYYWKLKSIVAVKGLASVSIIIESEASKKYRVYYDYKSKHVSETFDSFYKAILMVSEEGFVPQAFFYFFNSKKTVASENFPTGLSNKIELYLEGMRSNSCIKSKCITLKHKQELIKKDIEINISSFRKKYVKVKVYDDMQVPNSNNMQLISKAARNSSVIQKHLTDEKSAIFFEYKEDTSSSRRSDVFQAAESPKKVRNLLEGEPLLPKRRLNQLGPANAPAPVMKDLPKLNSPPMLNLPQNVPLLKGNAAPPNLNLSKSSILPQKLQPMQNSLNPNIHNPIHHQTPHRTDPPMIGENHLPIHEQHLPDPMLPYNRKSPISPLKMSTEWVATIQPASVENNTKNQKSSSNNSPYRPPPTLLVPPSFDKQVPVLPNKNAPVSSALPSQKSNLSDSAALNYNPNQPENIKPTENMARSPPLLSNPKVVNPPNLFNANPDSFPTPPKLTDPINTYHQSPPPIPGKINPPSLFKENPSSFPSPPKLSDPYSSPNPPPINPIEIQAKNIEAKPIPPPPQYYPPSSPGFETLNPPSIYQPHSVPSNLEESPPPNISQNFNQMDEIRDHDPASGYYNEHYRENPEEYSKNEYPELSGNSHIAEIPGYYPVLENYVDGNNPDFYSDNQVYYPEIVKNSEHVDYYVDEAKKSEDYSQEYEYVKNYGDENKGEVYGSNYDHQLEQYWECMECHNSNYLNAEFCSYCALAKNDQNLWLCTKCNIQNYIQNAYCETCKLAKPFYGDWVCVCGTDNDKDSYNCCDCNEPKETSVITYCDHCRENIYAYRVEHHQCYYA